MNFTFAPLLHLNRLEVGNVIFQKILDHINGQETIDLNNEEIQYLLDICNIKFNSTSNEFMCFYSIEVGRAGYGKNRLQAFENLLRIRGIIVKTKLDHVKLNGFLKISIPSP